MLSLRVRAAALVVAVLPAVAGCTGNGSGTPGPSASPSPGASGSATGSLTAPGSTLALGDTATVAYAPDNTRSTQLAITVTKVRKAPSADFVLFSLDKAQKAAAYYYVTMTIANTGTGSVGGDPVPVWGVDPDNVLLPPVSFGSPFKPCPSKPLPTKFAPGAHSTMCIVYQVKDNGDLKALSYRPDASFDPIVWSPIVLSK